MLYPTPQHRLGPSDAPERYELVHRLGRGAEGDVWKVLYRGPSFVDGDTPIPVALKLLSRPDGWVIGPWPTPAMTRSLQRMSDVLSRRPSAASALVGVRDCGLSVEPHSPGAAVGGAFVPYVEMELLEGDDLRHRYRGRPVTHADAKERLDAVARLARTAAALHSPEPTGGNALVLGDLAPRNVRCTRSGEIRILDLTAARFLGERDTGGWRDPVYSAPEVLRNPTAHRTPSSDAYSLGRTAAYCLTGEEPHTKHRGAKAIREAVRGAGLPAAVADQVLLLLRTEPSRRPADLATWADDLLAAAQPATSSPPSPAKRSRTPLLVLAALAVVVVSVGGAVAVTQLPRGASAAPRSTTSVPPVIVAAPPSPPVGSASPSATPSSAPTPVATAATTALKPTPSRSSPQPAPVATRAAAPVTPTGTVRPSNGSVAVDQCARFEGAVHLPSGRSIVVTTRNTTTGASTQYVQYPPGFDDPTRRTSWTAVVYFDSGAGGQQILVSLKSVPLAAERAGRQSHDAHASDAVERDDVLARSGVTLDSVSVRVNDDPAACAP